MTSNIDKDLTALVKLAKVQEKALAVTMKKINSLKKKIDVVVPKVKPVESAFMKTKINWYDDKI